MKILGSDPRYGEALLYQGSDPIFGVPGLNNIVNEKLDIVLLKNKSLS